MSLGIAERPFSKMVGMTAIHRQETVALEATTFEVPGAIRTARKPWRCVAEKEFRRWHVRRTCEHGWSEVSAQTGGEARAKADALEGTRCHGLHVPVVEQIEVYPLPNPEFRPDCLGEIAVGDRYFEYMGESCAWESGTRYCARCAVAVWAGKT